MNREGWIFMAISWTVILGLFVYSMVRTLSPKRDGDTGEHHGPDGF